MLIGNTLKKLRESKKLTVEQVTEHLSISSSSYRKYEYNEREPSTDVVIEIADFYEVSTDYLLGRTTVKQMATEQPDPLAGIDISAVEKQIIEKYTALDEDMRAVCIETFRQLSTALDVNQPKQRHVDRLGDIEDELEQERQAKAKDVI